MAKNRTKKKGCLYVASRFVMTVVGLWLAFVLVLAGMNAVVVFSTQSHIVTEQEMLEKTPNFNAQAIVVLGAGINFDGSPSSILKDRLDVAIDLYEDGVAPKLIMSGDNSKSTYNEVMAMCNYAIKQGVPAEDIFCDHAGVSTYDSMYRIHHVFDVKRCVVVTQEYHLYRALFNATEFDIEAYGVSSDLREYSAIEDYKKREFFARIKDFGAQLINVEPEKKSEPVSLNQSGVVTQWW